MIRLIVDYLPVREIQKQTVVSAMVYDLDLDVAPPMTLTVMHLPIDACALNLSR